MSSSSVTFYNLDVVWNGQQCTLIEYVRGGAYAILHTEDNEEKMVPTRELTYLNNFEDNN